MRSDRQTPRPIKETREGAENSLIKALKSFTFTQEFNQKSKGKVEPE